MRRLKGASLPVVCSIGSVDPSGAAGLTMDLQVYGQLGAAGVAAVAAVTAQNSWRVVAVTALPAQFVTKQLQLIWEQVPPNAICVGLLPDAAGIRAVKKFLNTLSPRPPIVIDPVLASSSGHEFLGAREVRELARLLPLATVITPNVHEAATLTSLRVATPEQAESAARQLSQHGCAALVTGGHLPGKLCVDILAYGGRVRRYAAARLPGTMRGAGGMLAAALAVALARGVALEMAVAQARRFVRRAYPSAAPLGAGRRQFMTLGKN